MRPIRCSLSTSRCLRVRPRPLVFPLHQSRSKPRFVSQSLRLLSAKSHPFVDLFRHPSFPNLFPTPTSFPLPPSPPASCHYLSFSTSFHPRPSPFLPSTRNYLEKEQIKLREKAVSLPLATSPSDVLWQESAAIVPT